MVLALLSWRRGLEAELPRLGGLGAKSTRSSLGDRSKKALARISLTSLADAACVEVTMASHEAALSVGPTIIKAGGEVGKHGYLALSLITVSAQEGERKKMGPGRFHDAADSVLLGMASSTKGKQGEGG